ARCPVMTAGPRSPGEAPSEYQPARLPSSSGGSSSVPSGFSPSSIRGASTPIASIVNRTGAERSSARSGTAAPIPPSASANATPRTTAARAPAPVLLRRLAATAHPPPAGGQDEGAGRQDADRQRRGQRGGAGRAGRAVQAAAPRVRRAARGGPRRRAGEVRRRVRRAVRGAVRRDHGDAGVQHPAGVGGPALRPHLVLAGLQVRVQG